MNVETDKVQKFGNVLVDMFHFLALFIIGATVVWSATYEYLHMMAKGYAELTAVPLTAVNGTAVC